MAGKNSAPDDMPVRGESPSLIPLKQQGIKIRRDFLAAAKARKAVTDSLILQDRKRPGENDGFRAGFTASKKVGNAVFRNRAKRRLRALAREILPFHAQSGHDYVLIARRDATVSLPFEALKADLLKALNRTQNPRKR